MKNIKIIFLILVLISIFSIRASAQILTDEETEGLPIKLTSTESVSFTLDGEQLFRSHTVIEPRIGDPNFWGFPLTKTIIDFAGIGSLSPDANLGDSQMLMQRTKFIYDRFESNNYGLMVRRDEYPENEWGFGALWYMGNLHDVLKDTYVSFAVSEGSNYTLEGDGLYNLSGENYQLHIWGLVRLDQSFARTLGDWLVELIHRLNKSGDISLTIGAENIADETYLRFGVIFDLI